MTNVKDGAVVVTKLDEGTPAAAAKLEPGTFILSVNDTRVLSPRDFRKAVTGLSGKVRLQIVRINSSVAETIELNAK